ncbi:MAG: amidohydrolase family protein [Rhizobiaceae bacterium]|nr:amidohydrolase family protein [Rhizobiaceae bacterium]
MEVIDAHRLVPPLRTGRSAREPAIPGQAMGDIDPATLRQTLEASGIAATILVQQRPSMKETQLSLAPAARLDLVAGLVGWVDLSARDVFGTIAALREGPEGTALVGISPGTDETDDGHWLMRSDVRRGIDAVAAHGLVLHLPLTEGNLSAALNTVGAFPSLRFVIHSLDAAFWNACTPATYGMSTTGRAISPLRPFAAEWGHVWCRLPEGSLQEDDDEGGPTQAALAEAPAIFGPARLLYGSSGGADRSRGSQTVAPATPGEAIVHLPRDERGRNLSGSARELYTLA